MELGSAGGVREGRVGSLGWELVSAGERQDLVPSVRSLVLMPGLRTLDSEGLMGACQCPEQ